MTEMNQQKQAPIPARKAIKQKEFCHNCSRNRLRYTQKVLLVMTYQIYITKGKEENVNTFRAQKVTFHQAKTYIH